MLLIRYQQQVSYSWKEQHEWLYNGPWQPTQCVLRIDDGIGVLNQGILCNTPYHHSVVEVSLQES